MGAKTNTNSFFHKGCTFLKGKNNSVNPNFPEFWTDFELFWLKVRRDRITKFIKFAFPHVLYK